MANPRFIKHDVAPLEKHADFIEKVGVITTNVITQIASQGPGRMLPFLVGTISSFDNTVITQTVQVSNVLLTVFDGL